MTRKTILVYKDEQPWQIFSGEEDFLSANLAFEPFGKAWVELLPPIPINLTEAPAYDPEKVIILQ